ncbi:hypothetical protein EDD16DRAFT_977204 [Pisolithus croceorrhizus]|nr:hypothetical protein EDD16DRAFT_977204 [Pisolithus croceorrhizus]KAI6167192.1 hypothetical protein EDD17DRAFT_1111998 [Pisolithus thermaeus]
MSARSAGSQCSRCSVSCAAAAPSSHQNSDPSVSSSSKSRTNLYSTSKLASRGLSRGCDVFDACSTLAEHLAPKDTERLHDTSWKLELEGNSSTTLLMSRPVSPDHFAAESQDDIECASPHHSSRIPYQLGEGTRCSVYPLDKPGDRISLHTRKLRLRTAAILQSLPATVEDTMDQLFLPREHPIQCSDQPVDRGSLHSSRKLRRVLGQTDLRDKFCQGISLRRDMTDKPSVDCNKSLSLPYLQSCIPAPSSSDTLVESDASCYSATLAKSKCKDSYLNLSLDSPPQPFLLPSASNSYMVLTCKDLHTSRVSSSSPSPHLHVRSSHGLPLVPCDEFGLVSVGGPLWSCAKITRSATKREARRAALRKKSRSVSRPSILGVTIHF